MRPGENVCHTLSVSKTACCGLVWGGAKLAPIETLKSRWFFFLFVFHTGP